MTSIPAPGEESEEREVISGMCFAPVNAAYSSVIAGTRGDLINLLDGRGIPPLFFDDFAGLQDWASHKQLSVQPLREQLIWSHANSGQPCKLQKWAECHGVSVGDFPRSKNNIVRVRSEEAPYVYDQLWVKASWQEYRKPFRSWHLLRDGLSAAHGLSTLNADHVVSKGVLKALGKPNAWVLLFPVEAQANQLFGALLEKKIAADTSLASADEIQLLSLFKVFSTMMPRAISEVDSALRDVKLQLRESSVDFDAMKTLLLQITEFDISN